MEVKAGIPPAEEGVEAYNQPHQPQGDTKAGPTDTHKQVCAQRAAAPAPGGYSWSSLSFQGRQRSVDSSPY
eukprot:1139377-Pelagomonas_calceolata.AAC.5